MYVYTILYASLCFVVCILSENLKICVLLTTACEGPNVALLDNMEDKHFTAYHVEDQILSHIGIIISVCPSTVDR